MPKITMDYPELEGKEIKYTTREGRVFDAVVAGCNYDVGITIVDQHDRRRRHVCLNGRTQTDTFCLTVGYDWIFKHLVKKIQKGHVNMGKTYKKANLPTGGGSMSSCAFGA